MRQRKTCIYSLILVMVLLCTACGNSARATVMQLMRTEGTVGVRDGEGKKLSPEDRMGLYSGYNLTTKTSSYAWIQLDNVKLTKMDQSSRVEIQRDGNDLEILVRGGKLFFHITEPLEKEENLNIRTSNLSVGIRGTCGWVEVPKEGRMQVYVLEGTVECSVTDPDTGESRSAAVSGGETAALSEEGREEIQVEPFEEGQIQPFVLRELKEDPALLEKIRQDSGLNITDFPEDGDTSSHQAAEELNRILGELQEGADLKDRVREAVGDARTRGPEYDSSGAEAFPLSEDSQEELVIGMFSGENGQDSAGWARDFCEAFAAEGPGSALGAGSTISDYMQIRMANSIRCYKPNIYLYGEPGNRFTLCFAEPVLLAACIPDYTDGWEVEIAGDGSLIVDGEEGYPYLFYESDTIPGIFQTEEGFLLEACRRRAQLEEILDGYGLNSREIQDFVEFWDDMLEEGEDYLMYPQTTERVDRAMPILLGGEELDNYFRIWFCFKKTNGESGKPELPSVYPADHRGKALVEWGGMILH